MLLYEIYISRYMTYMHILYCRTIDLLIVLSFCPKLINYCN